MTRLCCAVVAALPAAQFPKIALNTHSFQPNDFHQRRTKRLGNTQSPHNFPDRHHGNCYARRRYYQIFPSALWELLGNFELTHFLCFGNYLQETRLSALRPPSEFFDHNRLSRPTDLNQAVTVRRCRLFQLLVLIDRPKKKTAHFIQHSLFLWYIKSSPLSLVATNLTYLCLGNYGLIIAVLAVYAL